MKPCCVNRIGLAIVIMYAVIMSTSCGSVPRSDAKCVSGFRNGSEVLTDAELATAWSRAQQNIAQGRWVINALLCDPAIAADPVPCVYHAPDGRALGLTPDCVSVKGVHGLIDGRFTGEQDGNSVAIDIDYPHERVANLAEWEFENVQGQRLGFEMGDR
jgi:hypothetical protein